jgi:hypothetical protein
VYEVIILTAVEQDVPDTGSGVVGQPACDLGVVTDEKRSAGPAAAAVCGGVLAGCTASSGISRSVTAPRWQATIHGSTSCRLCGTSMPVHSAVSAAAAATASRLRNSPGAKLVSGVTV